MPTPHSLDALLEEFDEHAIIHEEHCPINSEYGCDAGVKTMECCDRMKTIKSFITQAYTLGKEEILNELRHDRDKLLEGFAHDKNCKTCLSSLKPKY